MRLDFNPQFLQETIEILQSYYEEKLTTEDAMEIASNMIEFFNLLAEWDEELVVTA